jgi:hypothetical protein
MRPPSYFHCTASLLLNYFSFEEAVRRRFFGSLAFSEDPAVLVAGCSDISSPSNLDSTVKVAFTIGALPLVRIPLRTVLSFHASWSSCEAL